MKGIVLSVFLALPIVVPDSWKFPVVILVTLLVTLAFMSADADRQRLFLEKILSNLKDRKSSAAAALALVAAWLSATYPSVGNLLSPEAIILYVSTYLAFMTKAP